MDNLIETLHLLQQQQRRPVAARVGALNVAELRARVPAPVLAHFDRLTAHGRKAVADVHHGVCGACHLRLPQATACNLAQRHELRFCEHCGAYLRFVEDPTPASPVASVA